MSDLLTPVVLGLHLATAHFGAPDSLDLQAATPGVYLRTEAGLTVGAYVNSYGRGSAYAGWTFSTTDGRWSITAGAVTGYHSAKVSPLVVPSVRLPLGNWAPSWAARIAYLPKPHSDGAQGLHLSLERSL